MKNRNVISIDIDPHKDSLKSLGLSNLGIYIGRDDWTVGKKLISQLLPKDKLQNYTKQDFIDSVDTVYRLPHLTLSRDKLALFAEECDFKVTRKRDIADIIVIGDQTIKKMVQNSYSSSIDFKTLKSCYSKGKEWKNLTSDDQNCMHKQVKLIEDLYGDDCEITFTQSYYYASSGYGEKLSRYRSYLKDYVTKQAGYLYYYPEASFNNMNFVKNNIDKVIFDSNLNLLCTEDSITINKEEFKSVYSMINSGDTENRSVGMTMMANCNVDKSRTFLCLLFAVCSNDMKNSNVWNQVNFKYLRKEFEFYIDIQLSSWGHAYSQLIKHMVKDKCLTAWAASLIASVMFKRVLEGNHQVGGKDCVFSLNASDLKLKNEYLVKLVNE
tara:strand:+ start:1090 stop:2235 length:1146 start_codon:yes stop_codon:yes gene_type:complete